jgi:citronellyl-CoA synthetase
MLSFFRKSLPAYAVPVFLRIQKQMETTGTFKYQKNTLKTQAFDPSKTDETILAWLPGENQYCIVTDDIYQNIQNTKYRF